MPDEYVEQEPPQALDKGLSVHVTTAVDSLPQIAAYGMGVVIVVAGGAVGVADSASLVIAAIALLVALLVAVVVAFALVALVTAQVMIKFAMRCSPLIRITPYARWIIE